MKNLQQISSQIRNDELLLDITRSFAESATIRLAQIRQKSTHNIYYSRNLRAVFTILQQLKSENLLKLKQASTDNGKTIDCLITSNKSMIGGADTVLCRKFMLETMNSDSEVLVIGTTGKHILQTDHYPKQFEFLDFSEKMGLLQSLDQLNTILNKYSKVNIYHLKFENLLSQTPTVTELKQKIEEKSEYEKNIHFILEPELNKMLDFFGNQIQISILQSIFLESDIARLASRMNSMNKAEKSAENLLKSDQRDLSIARKNAQDMETIGGKY